MERPKSPDFIPDATPEEESSPSVYEDDTTMEVDPETGTGLKRPAPGGPTTHGDGKAHFTAPNFRSSPCPKPGESRS